MSEQKLEIKAALKILKPLHEVFEGIVDPGKMSNYFISKSTGRMESDKTLTWQFPEMEMQFPVNIKEVRPRNYVSFAWNDMDGTETFVEINLTELAPDETFVTITEKSRDNNDAGINWLKRNTEGWANFLACLKAYLEYGVNLRKGAFDLSQMPSQK